VPKQNKHTTKDKYVHQHTLNSGCYKSTAQMPNKMERLQAAAGIASSIMNDGK
jgi:hypothetical protein